MSRIITFARKWKKGGVRFFDYLCLRYMKFACIISFLFVYIFSVVIEKDWRAEKQQLTNFVRVK